MALLQLESVNDALGWFAQRGGVAALTTDSRRVRPGAAFIAWPGHAQDGRQFVGDALASGAVACLVEADGAEAFHFEPDDRVAAMHRLKALTGPLASTFLDRPSERLSIVAATGTNGKTSTAWWSAQALGLLGRRAGVIGTLGIGEPDTPARPATVQATGLTTPDPVTLHEAFRRFADQGFSACAIEASSIGLAEDRLAGTHIDVALLTNFTRDHVDYHGSMTAYWHAKAQLFSWPGLKAAVLNVDDEQGEALARYLRAGRSVEVWTYSMQQPARLQAKHIAYENGGLTFELHEGLASAPVRTALVGDYNVSNVLAVAGALRALGVELADAARVCSHFTPVPGRMQRVLPESGEADEAWPDVVVDYAHTPDALEKVLLALRPLARTRGGALWCVFGCGGNRDATKRPLMGALAQRLADRVVVTNDNPRHEPATKIIAQILAGMSQPGDAQVMEDRRSAIRHAVTEAAPHDVILIAGKGHEAYQEIAGVKLAFSDMAEAQAALSHRGVAA